MALTLLASFGSDVGRTGRQVVELLHAVRQSPAKLADAWDKGFEVVPVLDPRIFGDLFQAFPFHPDQVHPQYGVIVKR